MSQQPAALYESSITSLPRIHRGKVRDIYGVGSDHMLIVTTDRLSAFDVIMNEPIPGKGAVLTRVSNFWFERTQSWLPNQIAALRVEDVLSDPTERAQVAGRAIVVRKLKALPIEAIIRGYIIGSGWKDYQQTGAVCGIALPTGLRIADRLPEPIFTPSTKAAVGTHDENIGFDEVVKLIGSDLANEVRTIALKLYSFAADYARERGIIVADTKFEFGLDNEGRVVLIDEALTPDSSRFWPADQYQPGVNPPSFDKQFVRDYLETLDWNKKAPAPALPLEIIEKTAEKYREAERRLLGK